MRIRRLRLVNYRRHRDVDMEFPDGVIAIVGRNGSGKTSLLEAIAFALYGTQATRTAKALLRNDQAAKGDPLRVELDAEVAGQALSIVRELRGSQQTGVASLVVDGQTIVPAQTGSFDAVTEEVASRIGLDRDTFFTTVFAQQKDLARLGSKSKADRKRLVLGMLGIDALDRAIQEARTLRRTSEARVQALQEQGARYADAEADEVAAREKVDAARKAAEEHAGSWTQAQAALQEARQAHQALAAKADEHRRAEATASQAQQDVKHLRQRVADIERRLHAAHQAAADMEQHVPLAGRLPELKQAYEQAVQAAAGRKRREALETRAKELQQRLDAIQVPPAPNGLLDQARADLESATAAHARAREQVAVISAQARGIKDRLRRIVSIGDAPCPVCERPLEAEQLQAHLDQELVAEQEKAQRAGEQAEQAARAVEEATARNAQAEAAQRTHEQAVAQQAELRRSLEQCHADLATFGDQDGADPDTIRPELEAAEAATAALVRLRVSADQRPALEADHATALASLATSEEAAKAATEAVAACGHDPAALAEAQAWLDAATSAERDAERAVTQARQAAAVLEAKVEQAQARVKEAQEAREGLRKAQRDHRLYEALAGTRGAGIMERFRSHLVGRIGPAVSAEASRLLASFTNGRYTEVLLDEDYDLYVTDEGVPYHLDRFSGGESDLVHLALRLAVSRLLLERSGAEIRFLALDEVFGSLDDERRGLVLGALQELGTLYSQVFLVTHHEDMRDNLDHTLMVEDSPDGARIRMHND